MTTNHWHLYKSDVWEGGGGQGAGVYWARGGGAMTCPSAEAETGVGYNTDGAVSFSSLWRYKAGMGFAAARAKVGALVALFLAVVLSLLVFTIRTCIAARRSTEPTAQEIPAQLVPTA